ncbi:hypothetical protein [Bacillus paralicheniformis]|jgi:hypothetical protein|uniref:hypothetical protein n=1 Tax=Bacillus paralicheniformis TaxID=1648923 RepID=UPI000A8BFBE4|nr:hypothetical protein D5285_17360 [Bacillus paralicheniformis]QFY37549.1 hypothetical protein D2B33_03410 [Bacillus paralicheniformis]TJW26159.1 hypothetical protein E7L52_05655 [Bacillus paralicheniformis]TWL06778.1 hypothetical protein CHCC19468_3045 [Bacillus paralicheniformis]TWL10779.1 hypothetical protein CHCC19467_3609 [Bacillus paralicheniformis]
MTKTNEKIHVLADESLGGIKREYVEVDRKAEVGERIIVVEADCQSEYRNGDMAIVSRFVKDDSRFGYYAESILANGQSIALYDREYNVLEPTNVVHIAGPDGTERYEMVDREAEVDEKIVIIAPDDGLSVDGDIGKIATVTEVFSEEDIDASPMGWVKRSEYLVLVPVESSEEEPQPSDPIDVIANLATRVAELERENKRIKEDLGWNEMGPGRIAELRNADSDIRHDIAALEEKVEHDRAENVEMDDYVYEEMKRMKDEIDTLHKDNRRHGEELEALKYAAKETDGKVAHLEADIEKSFPATDAPLVFICRKPGRFEVYQDGKKLHGVMSVRINAKVGEFATHEIEYISGTTKEERQ